MFTYQQQGKEFQNGFQDSHKYIQGNQQDQPQICPYCKGMKHAPFLPDGGSVLICQTCRNTFPNIHYNTNQGPKSPWFSDQYKAAENAQKVQEQTPNFTPRMKPWFSQNSDQVGWTPVKNNPQMHTQNRAMMQSTFRPTQSHVGMRGEGNYQQGKLPENPVNNNYADHANNQLRAYRNKFNMDHNGS